MPTYAEKHWGDCSKAVAYKLNFVQMCYNDNSDWDDFYENTCDSCWNLTQVKNYWYPKGGFSKKDYYILDFLDYGVSEQLKNDMVAFGISEENFKPIFNKKGDVIFGYQIAPINKLPPSYAINGYYVDSICKKCGKKKYEILDCLSHLKVYNGLGYPFYFTEDILAKLGDIACACEDGQETFISLKLYNHLLKKYPRLECRPVFLGSVFDDPEFKKLKEERSSK